MTNRKQEAAWALSPKFQEAWMPAEQTETSQTSKL